MFKKFRLLFVASLLLVGLNVAEANNSEERNLKPLPRLQS
jgi:hypothetical protein